MGYVTIVDDEDYEELSRFLWQARTTGTVTYACRNVRNAEGKRRPCDMHRLILDARPGQTIDHINGDSLDNRRDNLRFCTRSENSRNRAKHSTARGSTYLGVWFQNQGNRTKPWVARASVLGGRRHIGSFSTEEDAARAYDRWVIQSGDKFLRLNFPATPVSVADNTLPLSP